MFYIFGLRNYGNDFIFFLFIFLKVLLNMMFGYFIELRIQIQGQGEFIMEYSKYCSVFEEIMRQLTESTNIDNKDIQEKKRKRN